MRECVPTGLHSCFSASRKASKFLLVNVNVTCYFEFLPYKKYFSEFLPDENYKENVLDKRARTEGVMIDVEFRGYFGTFFFIKPAQSYCIM